MEIHKDLLKGEIDEVIKSLEAELEFYRGIKDLFEKYDTTLRNLSDR